MFGKKKPVKKKQSSNPVTVIEGYFEEFRDNLGKLPAYKEACLRIMTRYQNDVNEHTYIIFDPGRTYMSMNFIHGIPPDFYAYCSTQGVYPKPQVTSTFGRGGEWILVYMDKGGI